VIKLKNMNIVLLGFIGPWQIGLIVAIVLLLFGGKKIPRNRLALKMKFNLGEGDESLIRPDFACNGCV